MYSRGAYSKMFVNFEGEVEQFETLGFQPRMLDFHNQNHQMQTIDKYILNNSGRMALFLSGDIHEGVYISKL